MAEAVQVAHQRRKDYQASIAKKKSEIEELEEMIGDLESFIEFGESLTGKETVTVKAISRPVTPEKAVSRPLAQEKSVSRPMPQEKSKSDDEVDPADEWATDDNKSGIGRVLSQRIG